MGTCWLQQQQLFCGATVIYWPGRAAAALANVICATVQSITRENPEKRKLHSPDGSAKKIILFLDNASFCPGFLCHTYLLPMVYWSSLLFFHCFGFEGLWLFSQPSPCWVLDRYVASSTSRIWTHVATLALMHSIQSPIPHITDMSYFKSL